MFRLLLLAGQRKQEMAAASWEEFDIPGGRWTIPANRSKKRPNSSCAPQRVHSRDLESMFLGASGAAPLHHHGTTSNSGFSKAKERVDALSGVGGWTIHDLRRRPTQRQHGSMSFMTLRLLSLKPRLPIRTTMLRAENDQRYRIPLQNVIQMSLHGLVSRVVVSRQYRWIELAA
jgi:integrase